MKYIYYCKETNSFNNPQIVRVVIFEFNIGYSLSPAVNKIVEIFSGQVFELLKVILSCLDISPLTFYDVKV